MFGNINRSEFAIRQMNAKIANSYFQDKSVYKESQYDILQAIKLDLEERQRKRMIEEQSKDNSNFEKPVEMPKVPPLVQLNSIKDFIQKYKNKF